MKLSEFEKKIIEEFCICKENITLYDIDINYYRSCIVENEIKRITGINVFCSEVYSEFPTKVYINENETFLSDTLLYQKNRTKDKGFIKVKIM